MLQWSTSEHFLISQNQIIKFNYASYLYSKKENVLFMPENIIIAIFVFSTILILIAILGGNFKLFGSEILGTVSSPWLRFLSGFLGAALMIFSLKILLPQHSSGLPACNEVQALHSWWSPSREENFTTSTPQWTDRVGATRPPDYQMFRVEGYVYREQKPGTIPLYSWYSPSREDNFITSDLRWSGSTGDVREPDYVFVRIEGYILDPNLPSPEADPPVTQLSSFWSPSREENFATSDPQWAGTIGDMRSPDYSLYRDEGFLHQSCKKN